VVMTPMSSERMQYCTSCVPGGLLTLCQLMSNVSLMAHISSDGACITDILSTKLLAHEAYSAAVLTWHRRFLIAVYPPCKLYCCTLRMAIILLDTPLEFILSRKSEVIWLEGNGAPSRHSSHYILFQYHTMHAPHMPPKTKQISMLVTASWTNREKLIIRLNGKHILRAKSEDLQLKTLDTCTHNTHMTKYHSENSPANQL
jgi:hypothetical protein